MREGAAVASVEPGGVTLEDGERLACEHVVVATGPWAAALTGLPLEPRKGQLVALAAPPGLIRHKLIEAAYVDAVAAGDEGLAMAVVVEQTLDGDEVLVGSSRERVGLRAHRPRRGDAGDARARRALRPGAQRAPRDPQLVRLPPLAPRRPSRGRAARRQGSGPAPATRARASATARSRAGCSLR